MDFVLSFNQKLLQARTEQMVIFLNEMVKLLLEDMILQALISCSDAPWRS